MELVRQPIFLLLMVCSSGFSVFLAAVPYFGFGDDPKMVKDTVLAAMLLSGLFGAVICSSYSVAREIRTGTALAVLSKPVGRIQFLLAKYCGLAGVLTLLTYANTLSTLIVSKIAYDAYGDADVRALAIYFGLVAVGFLLAGFANYFLRRPFVADAVFATVVMMTIAMLWIVVLKETFSRNPYDTKNVVDLRMVPASCLILCAFYVLAGIALACTTRLDIVPTLAICSGFFVIGLMSDYLFGRPAADGNWWASVLYALVPNWQLFWLADALTDGRTIPWSYVGKAFGYVVGYVGALLCLAMLAFENRELA